ncbi:MAG: hypothetical protein LC775_03930 [Acidobacteria bacterium]|nr:hypothetical protein [Acidobacteriota bacterium]
MKTFKATCAALVMAFSLSIPAYASTDPGDVHVPGKPTPICSDTPISPAEIEVTDPATVEGDLSLSALTDILWALASIF